MRPFTFADPGFIGSLSSLSGTVAFSYIGANLTQGWTVPAGVTGVVAKAWGAWGADFDGSTLGGLGSYVRGTMRVTGGQNIAVKVNWGGGSLFGGGYSAVEYPSGVASTIALAGGGGAAGYNGLGSNGNGGDGGPTGLAGTDGAVGIGSAGQGGTPTAGGAAGIPGGAAGSFLQGGAGDSNGGGGGGGGYYGGGGGGGGIGLGAGGGGGGSSFVSGCFNVTNTGVNFSDPNWSATTQGRVVLIYFRSGAP